MVEPLVQRTQKELGPEHQTNHQALVLRMQELVQVRQRVHQSVLEQVHQRDRR